MSENKMNYLVVIFFCFAINYIIYARPVDAEAESIGVNYGLRGDNLPPPEEAIALIKSKKVQKIRIFDPNPEVLNALRSSDLELVLGTRNEDLQKLASDSNFATEWVNTHVLPYIPSIKFRYVTAGNEVIPSPLAMYVLDAMKNLNAAFKAAKFHIPVSTVVHFATLSETFPPSNGTFSDEVSSTMTSIVKFLNDNQYPLLVNTYPCFAYFSDPVNVRADYALGTAVDGPVVTDGEKKYTNLFDAMIDAMYSAMEKVGGEKVKIVVSETGWPSSGGEFAKISNAQTYANNVIKHVSSSMGTPKRPGENIETYIFALFNENLKPAGTEQNFGLFHPDMTEVYHVDV